MAMIECPECGRRISDQADSCPGCGISQVKIQKMHADMASLATSKKEENISIKIKDSAVKESIKSVLTTIETIEEEYTPRVKLKSVRCVVCNTSFQKTEGTCPKCKYPLLSFCGNDEKLKQLVKVYRKEAGVETARPVKKKLDLQVGQYCRMGRYQREEINWRVLAVEGMRALLISEKVLDAKQYHEKPEATTWERCSLRKWLNGEFFDEAFTVEEKTRIFETHVSADANPACYTNSGNDTVDNVFLLSIREVKEYFKDDNDRKVYPTEFTKKTGANIDDNTNCCQWWLRSPGEYSKSAARVLPDGWINYYGDEVDSNSVSVRPALWVKL